MRKKKKKGVSSPEPKTPLVTVSKDTSAKDDQDELENPFDFGGLPARNLKKNLGCG